ncbi:MAG: response regulator [Candidatus Marinimicrobia bacterium]|nr:response regulator [Candidatus Neomarinimicrobiota bacterium]MBT3634504.1 response regulator [Candidatus Neomarinimicrobiota bacterium]MBT3683401.1 response regulator [Candidatus Neomarinimicrobiota bacterium]MBT3760289.1 response regulator [Candidatus Neomarinimicrobiota bacterium]MBT3896384.1 response regulator [Candidatus Neomarinimicrobiota bacterium]
MKVLFVEDSLTMRRVIKNSLKNIGFTDIIEAENGEDALKKIENTKIDLVLTDWNMPEMNGEQLVLRLRSMDMYKSTPILMITTRGLRDDVLNAIKIGVNGYLVKPFDAATLKKKLSKCIDLN